MGPISLILIAVGLAMDAFAVSICKGLAMRRPSFRSMLTIGLWFGGFQAIMPAIGYLLGSSFHGYIKNIDHWIAFALLAAIGINMIRESFDENDSVNDDIGFKVMLLLAIATSIDALAVGISLAMDGSDILTSVTVIGIITMIISMIGVRIGGIFGNRYSNKAEFAGGCILIVIGLKVLLEHLCIL